MSRVLRSSSVILVFALTMVLLAGTSQGSILPPGNDRLSFNDQETFLNANGTVDAPTNQENFTITTGQTRIVGVSLLNNINGGNNVSPTQQIVGVYDMTVVGFAPEAGVTAGNAGKYYMFLAPTSIVDQTGSSGGILAADGTGTGIAFYENPTGSVTTDLQTAGTPLATVVSDAQSGQLDATFGFGTGATQLNSSAIGLQGGANYGYWVSEVNVGSGPSSGTTGTYTLSAYNGETSTFFYGLLPTDGGYFNGLGYQPLSNPTLGNTDGYNGTTNTFNGVNSLIINNFGGSFSPTPDLLPAATMFNFTGTGTTTGNSNADNAIFPVYSADPCYLDPNPEPSALAVWGLLGVCGIFGGWFSRRRAS